MNLDLHCLSLMELLELRDGFGDQEGLDHLQSCIRCQALLATLPATVDVPTPIAPRTAIDTGALRLHTTAEVRTGSLWRAIPHSNSDFAWVVAVIGRSPETDQNLIVAPVADTAALSTAVDLILDRGVLGYDAFIDLANIGTVMRSQLVEPVGRLAPPLAQALVDQYKHVLADASASEASERGLPVLDDADPRLLHQAARSDALKALWRPVLETVDAGQADEAQQTRSAEAAVTSNLAGMLALYLTDPQSGWDRASLLEQSDADGQNLARFLSNQLDLTDKTDVPDLARIVHTLDVPWSVVEPAVSATLGAAAGGSRLADGPDIPMAARSRAGADPDQTTRDLYADQSTIDISERARSLEIAAYLDDLRRELDQLE